MRIFILVLALIPALSFADEKAITPKPGSKERKAILDTIRAPLQKKLKQPLLFRVSHLKMKGDWAFLIGQPRTKDDKPIDYSKTEFAEEDKEADELLVVLFQRKKGKWTIVTDGLFTTDVWWMGLDKRYKAPSTIFPEGTTSKE